MFSSLGYIVYVRGTPLRSTLCFLTLIGGLSFHSSAGLPVYLLPTWEHFLLSSSFYHCTKAPES